MILSVLQEKMKLIVYTLISSCTLANIALYNSFILLILNPVDSTSLHFAIVDLIYFLVATIITMSLTDDTPKRPPKYPELVRITISKR